MRRARHAVLAAMVAAGLLCGVVSATNDVPLHAGQRFRVTSGSAGFDLGATLHTVHGHTAKVRGQVAVSSVDDRGAALAGRIAVDAATLDTGNERRDRTMRDTSLAVAQHPEIVFEPRRLERSAGRSDEVVGSLTVRGVTRPARFALTLSPGPGGVSVRGSGRVRWSDFGVPDPSFLMVRIEKTVRVRFEAELRAEP